MKQVFAHPKGTLNLGLGFRTNSDPKLMAYSEANYAGDMDERRSTSGNVMFSAHGPVAWLSQKQPVVAVSMAEADYVALCEATKELFRFGVF